MRNYYLSEHSSHAGHSRKLSQAELLARIHAYSATDWQEDTTVRCWKKLMNIFFSIKWQSLILITVILNSYLVVLRMQTSPAAWTLYYYYFDDVRLFCTVMYLIDTIARIAHRIFTKLRLTQSHRTHPIICIVLDILSLIPLDTIYELIATKTSETKAEDHKAFFCANQLLQLYRVPLTAYRLETTFDLNHILVYFTGTVGKVFILTHITEFIWLQVLGYWLAAGGRSWLTYVSAVFDVESSVELYALSASVIITMLNRFFQGIIQLTNNAERTMAACMWLLGFFIEYGLTFGGLLPSLYANHRLRFIFVEVSQILENYLRIRDIPPETAYRVREYYRELWATASGVKKSQFFPRLPLSLRKEIMMDVYWNAFKHSNILSVRPIAVKRSLGMIMEQEYYLPGEVLYQRGREKNMMFYIVSGVIEVLALEDNKTPIASFTAGTVMGEVSLIFPYTSQNTVRCATFCVVQILRTWPAMPVLIDYPDSTVDMADILKRRVQYARQLRAETQALRPEIMEGIANPTGELKWMKDHWRLIFNQQMQIRHLGHVSISNDSERRTANLMKQLRGENMERYNHTSAFFDLVTLTDESAKETSSMVCLRANWPWILEANSDFILVWEVVLATVVLYECYILPYNLSFKDELATWVQTWGIICDAILIIDIYIITHTAVEGVKISAIAIIIHQAQTLVFWLRLIAAIPWHWIALLFNADLYNAQRLRFLRMVWLTKIIRWLNALVNKVGGISFIVKYLVIFASLVYWMACWQSLFNCYRTCSGVSWYSEFIQYQVATGQYENDNRPSRFYYMLLYTASTLLRVSLLLTSPMSMADVLLQFVMLFLSYAFACYWTAEYSSLQLLRSRSKRRFADLIVNFEYVQRITNVPEFFIAELMRFLSFQWATNGGLELPLEDNPRLESIPRYLADDLKKTARDIVRSIPIFASSSDDIVSDLADNVVFFDCPTNMQLTRAGEHTASIFFVRRGLCRCVSHWRPDVERRLSWTLSTGDCFPLMEVMHQIPAMVSVRTESACVMAMLEVQTFRRTLARYPDEQRLVDALVEEHRALWNLTDIPMDDPVRRHHSEKREQRARHRLMQLLGDNDMDTRAHARRSEDGQLSEAGSEFADVEDGEVDEEEVEYERAWSCFNFLRRCLRPLAWDPASEFVFRWEVMRVTVAMIGVLLHPCAYSAFIDSLTARIICILLDVICFVDVIIRMQIGFYNQEGILITHPFLTMKHYLKNAFVLDVMSFFPFEVVPIGHLFGVTNTAYLRFWVRILRCLQGYRFWVFMDYLDALLTYRFLTANIVKCVAVIISVMNWVANALLYWHCEVVTEGAGVFYFEEVDIECSFDNVLTDTFLKNAVKTPLEVYLVHLYYAIVVYTTSNDGLFMFHASNIKTTLLLSVLTFFVRNWMIATVASVMAAMRWRITHSRNNLKHLHSFLRREGVDNHLVLMSVEAVDMIWRRRRGLNLRDVFSKVPPMMHSDLMYSRFRFVFERVTPLQGAHKFLLRELSRCMEMHLFNEGRFILRVNDVQGCVFILASGSIEVISAGDESLAELKQGAIFGNLPRRHLTRHTCAMVVRESSIVFISSNEVFYELLDNFPETRQNFDDLNESQWEFVPDTKHVDRPTWHSVLDELQEAERAMEPKSRRDIMRRYASKKPIFREPEEWATGLYKLVKTGKLRLFISNFIVYIVIPPSYVCVLLSVVLGEDPLICIVVMYLCDAFYVLKISVELWLPYMDPVTNTKVRSMKVIVMKNLGNVFGFPLDILSTLPLELLGSKYLRLNRLLRVIQFVKHFYTMYNELTASTFIRWVRLIILFVIFFVSFMSLYIVVRCDRGLYCEYLQDVHHVHKVFFRVSIDVGTTLTLAFLFTMNKLLCSSFTEPPINRVSRLVYQIFITIAEHVILVSTISSMACLVHSVRNALCDYRYFISRMDTYLQNLDVSMTLRKKVQHYMTYLWTDEKGRTMPQLLLEAPQDLRFDLMDVMYGNFLLNDQILSVAHEDLLLQMVGYVRRYIYLPGEVVVEKDDVDGCMYILQKGEVKAVDYFLTESVIFTVPEGTVFGHKSGLIEGTPHKFTYRASILSVVLSLNLEQWKYLYEFFPSSKDALFKRVENL